MVGRNPWECELETEGENISRRSADDLCAMLILQMRVKMEYWGSEFGGHGDLDLSPGEGVCLGWICVREEEKWERTNIGLLRNLAVKESKEMR